MPNDLPFYQAVNWKTRRQHHQSVDAISGIADNEPDKESKANQQ